jgi:hypothetical protein
MATGILGAFLEWSGSGGTADSCEVLQAKGSLPPTNAAAVPKPRTNISRRFIALDITVPSFKGPE